MLSQEDLPIPVSLGSFPVDITEQAIWWSLSKIHHQSRIYGVDTYLFLPAMLEATRPGSCLDAAGQAISVIHLANRSLSLELRDKSNLAYAQGVSAVNVALTDPDLRYKDETLVAIWLLGQREVCSLNHNRIDLTVP
jgi:hypothetical protein